MEAKLSKEAILHACRIKQELTIADFEKEIHNLEKEISVKEDSQVQGDTSAPARNEVREEYEEGLAFLKGEMELLEGIDPNEKKDVVQPGAVVVTDKRIFFVSVSIEEVNVNGEEIFGLSTQAPIYLEMRLKRVGDHFEFNSTKYKILDVY